MKYWVGIGDRSYVVSIQEGEGHTVAELDVVTMELQLEEGATGTYTLVVDGKTYSLAAMPHSAGYSVAVRGVPFDVAIEDDRQHRLSAASKAKELAEGTVSLRAPMAGRVARVDAVEGHQVAKGDRLLVLEAMKMENDIRAPRAGRTGQVQVSTGQTVEQGQLLLVLE
jgi:biotin carboxyl carrier protein